MNDRYGEAHFSIGRVMSDRFGPIGALAADSDRNLTRGKRIRKWFPSSANDPIS